MKASAGRLLKSFGAKDKAVVTALQRRPELLSELKGTALERYRLFCGVLKGFGLSRAVAREVCVPLRTGFHPWSTGTAEWCSIALLATGIGTLTKRYVTNFWGSSQHAANSQDARWIT